MSAPTIINFGLQAAVATEVCATLNAIGYNAVAAQSLRDLTREVTAHPPALIIVDDVGRIAAWAAGNPISVPVVLLAADECEARAVRALRFGATDYFRWPREREALLKRVRQLVPPPASDADDLTRVLVGESQAMKDVRSQIQRAAETDCNVLLVGETGTGKELAAGLLHDLSSRKSGPFIGVNCAAIPDTLLESELFGYEKGAFTDAVTSYEGKLQQAHRGTLFLDEIGDMSLLAQAKVLRAFEARPVYRLGGRTPLSLDVRLVSATNSDLSTATRDGRFRPDLFFRLNVAQIHLPPLRDRPEDIPRLLGHYVRECNVRYKRHGQELSRETVHQLMQYPWPGNVRELRNVIEATFVNSRSRWLCWADLPAQFRRQLPVPLDKPRGDERERLISALADTQWNKSQAADRLHWSRMTLYRKLAKYRVEER